MIHLYSFGTAASKAPLTIPQSFQPGIFGGSVSIWQGEQAIAIGVEGRYVVKAGATYNSRGKGGAAAGVGFAF